MEGIGTFPNNSGGFDFYWRGGNLLGVRQFPIQVSVPNKLVYSAHDYGPDLFAQPWFNGSTTYDSLSAVWRKYWAYIDEESIAPVLVGEFGTANDALSVSDQASGSQGQWFASLARFLGTSNSFSWAYWSVNGEDRYGLLKSDYADVALTEKHNMLLQMHMPNRVYLPIVARQ